MVLETQGWDTMQTKKFIAPGGAMRIPQYYGVVHYLDESLLDDYSFPVKKFHHKTISHLFSRMDDIRGHKDNISAAEKSKINLV
jgi:hypothetical protein